MAQMGALLIHYRAHFVKRLQEAAPPIHRDFSGGGEELYVVPCFSDRDKVLSHVDTEA